MQQTHVMGGLVLAAILAAAAFALLALPTPVIAPVEQPLNATPQDVTLTGTYVCLPKITPPPHTDECAFGLVTDDGTYYAVHFGSSADAMAQFTSGARITAEGNVVIKEALSASHWQQYEMVGIFSVTKILDANLPTEEPTDAPQGKLDITSVCQGALAYMTFPDGASADAFVAACIAGEHPEVIERFKADRGLDGAVI